MAEPETKAAQERVERALKEGIAGVKTPAQAAQVIDELEALPTVTEAAVAEASGESTPASQAAAIVETVNSASPEAKPAAVITEIAAQSAGAADADKPVLDGAVLAATGMTSDSPPPPQDVRRARRLLRRELFRRLRPLQALDATLFIELNHLPHPRVVDQFISRFSWVMTAGTGWLVILLAGLLIDRRRGWKAVVGVAPALWLATITVEYPMKAWFRRRRPFIDLLRAVVVGRKPASYSFPSGHSASAFAGAVLLARHYPRQAQVFYAIAGLVAFSRVYLGAHYPGDVFSGSVSGAVLARVYARLLFKHRRP